MAEVVLASEDAAALNAKGDGGWAETLTCMAVVLVAPSSSVTVNWTSYVPATA